MDKQLLQKYFRNQCSLEEIEQVLNWFRTKEGQRFFEEHLDRDMQQYADEEKLLLYPDIPTEKMLRAIEIELLKKNKNPSKNNLEAFPASTEKPVPEGSQFLPVSIRSHPGRNHSNWRVRTAVAVLICSVLAGSYIMMYRFETHQSLQEPEINYRALSTQEDQQRLVTLGDGTRIRLNSNSSIRVPEHFPDDERIVTLTGEAWFDVAQDENRPFSLRADRTTIRVLGTAFNVKVDTLSRNVQVAVAEGRVSLGNGTDETGRGAILTDNTFGVFDLDNEEILIEHTPVENYLSWISGRLQFYNEPLWVVSRYLNRLYGVDFRFEEESLKDLHLSTDLAREELTTVLDIIARTLGIGYHYESESNTVLWIWTNNTNR